MRKEVEDILLSRYGELSAQEISEIAGISQAMVYYYARKLGLSKSKEWIVERASKPRVVTDEKRRYILEHYADTPIDEIIRATGLKKASIYGTARKLGIRRSEEHIKETRRMLGKTLSQSPASIRTRFSKGSIPVNKGRAMSEETRRKVSRTFFKKGNTPHNACKVGDMIVTSDGYAKIKIADNKWRFRSVLVWEAAHGAVPEGHIICHMDGDKLNDDLSNLRLLNKREHLLKNRFRDYPIELIEVWDLSLRLKQKLGK